MGFEEIFESKRRFHGNYGKHEYQEKHGGFNDSSNPAYGQSNHSYGSAILAKIWNNKKLRVFAILTGLLLLAFLVILSIVLLPIIIKFFDYISQNGLQGLLDYVTTFMNKILKG